LAIGQGGHGSAFSQALSFRDTGQQFVDQTETGDNTIVQVHDLPPQSLLNRPRIVDLMSIFFGKNTCTSGWFTVFTEHSIYLKHTKKIED
jgi:hypothetical protein